MPALPSHKAALPEGDEMDPELKFVFEVRVAVGSPIDVGETRNGRRRIIPIVSGTVSGPRLQGTVREGGSDWQHLQPDGLTELVARYLIEASDGTLITVVNRGVRRGPPEVMARLIAGEKVDPSLVYFRAIPTMEAPPGPHDWLNRSIFVTAGERSPDAVVIRFFEVV
jgi:hypothetical protein